MSLSCHSCVQCLITVLVFSSLLSYFNFETFAYSLHILLKLFNQQCYSNAIITLMCLQCSDFSLVSFAFRAIELLNMHFFVVSIIVLLLVRKCSTICQFVLLLSFVSYVGSYIVCRFAIIHVAA